MDNQQKLERQRLGSDDLPEPKQYRIKWVEVRTIEIEMETEAQSEEAAKEYALSLEREHLYDKLSIRYREIDEQDIEVEQI